MAQQKTLVIVRGKGTTHETRRPTTIPLSWSKHLQRWVTIPQGNTYHREGA